MADTVDDKVDEAEDVQDALNDLERAGKRRERLGDDFDAELAGFDGELGMADNVNDELKIPTEEEHNHEMHTEDTGAVAADGVIA